MLEIKLEKPKSSHPKAARKFKEDFQGQNVPKNLEGAVRIQNDKKKSKKDLRFNHDQCFNDSAYESCEDENDCEGSEVCMFKSTG